MMHMDLTRSRLVVGVMVRRLRPADLVAEPGQRDPVGAGVAVHPDVAVDRLVVPLQHQAGQFRAAPITPAGPATGPVIN